MSYAKDLENEIIDVTTADIIATAVLAEEGEKMSIFDFWNQISDNELGKNNLQLCYEQGGKKAESWSKDKPENIQNRINDILNTLELSNKQNYYNASYCKNTILQAGKNHEYYVDKYCKIAYAIKSTIDKVNEDKKLITDNDQIIDGK